MQPQRVTRASIDVQVAAPGLDAEHFRKIGGRELGGGENSYAHSVAWFKNRLYVGTTRNYLTLHKRAGRMLPPPEMEVWPVIALDPMPPDRMRAEIWRYDPASDHWDRLHRAPMIERNGMEVMRDLGYRGMIVYQGLSDPEPAIYVGSISGTGARILRCVDGEHFEDVAKPDLTDPPSVSIRSMTVFRGRLYCTVVGTEGKSGNESGRPLVYESDDPANNVWRAVSPPAMGDDQNRAIAEMAAFNDHLYAATLNPTSGFQLWKTRAEGEPPYPWKRVLSGGASRGYLNEAAAHMAAFGGALYIGTGIAGGGYNRFHKIGPAPSELIRVHADDSWDLIMGAPRATPHGLKLPLSGMGPGFNFPLTGYTWQICEHEGWMYVGTYNPAVFMPWKPVRVPDEYLALLGLEDTEAFVEKYGGCHLWRSHDGEHFIPVTLDGFGTRYNYGLRQMVSTPVGLFAGTANPFGPEVAVKRQGEWTYEPNPRGGMEIWLGARAYAGEPLSVARLRRTAAPPRRQLLSHIAQYLTHLVFARLTDRFYEGSGFAHMGLWREDTASAKEACENLMEALVDLVPDRRGPVLDVGCGEGATTQVLARHFPEGEIAGIDLQRLSLDAAQRRVPRARFRIMSPTRMEFSDRSFRTVVCVEKACTFESRRDFLREAFRVLNSGGRLVLTDLLYSRTGDALAPSHQPRNHLSSPAAYVRVLEREGFKEIRVTSVTDATARRYLERLRRFFMEKFLAREITEGDFSSVMALASEHALFLTHYVLVSATKL